LSGEGGSGVVHCEERTRKIETERLTDAEKELKREWEKE